MDKLIALRAVSGLNLRRRICMLFAPIFMALCAFFADAVSAATLDQKKIHQAYNEGDFEMVLTNIEAFTKDAKEYGRADSIFIAKHLAVVYTANPQTREKGKYYMYRLLDLLPSAQLVDMYVSDEIDHIFDKVRAEFVNRQRSFGVDSSRLSLPDKPVGRDVDSAKAATPSRKEAKIKPGYWIAGGVGMMAGGILLFHMMQERERDPEVLYHMGR